MLKQAEKGAAFCVAETVKLAAEAGLVDGCSIQVVKPGKGRKRRDT
jgi:hypothetical protein